KFVGNWLKDSNASHSGGTAVYSTTVGNYIEFSFTGTGFKWAQPVNPNRGIANITIDGTAYTADTYSATSEFQKITYSKTDLTSGNHTVRITITSNKNSAS
ncbi:hemoblobin-interacting domain-containing protein, partial [Clostridium zeae]|uniref:hemoblobin-interacting domain-containing protein n=1 Tax=Clostridium zeae TaxID=2759022 RepID=UPI003FCC6FD3